MTKRHRRFKDAVYEQIARIGKAAASPKRLELLDLLSQAPRTVEALAQQASISVANTSRHLQVLRAARLVEAEKRGLYVEYRVAGESVSGLLLKMRSEAETRLGEMERVVRQYFHDHGAMEPVDGAELLRRVRAGEALLLDVRPPEEYQAGHIPGALSVPLSELKKRLASLPKDREIVAYCRGPYCAWASEAVETLRKKGFRAQRMALGVIDWRMKGFAVETASGDTGLRTGNSAMTAAALGPHASDVRLGIRENLGQFSLLVLINAFVGAMVGMERSILPAIAAQDFHLAAHTAVLSFIVVFGVTKALTNYLAGRLSDRYGRRVVLVCGWLVAAPVPLLLMWAPSWTWVLVANVCLGVSQGLTWSTTVIMKIDLAGTKNRGLAMGLNEFAGYFAVAAAALGTGWIASRYGLRPEPFYLGIGFVASGLLLSALAVRETKHHAARESQLRGDVPQGGVPSPREVFWRTTLLDKNLSSVTQAGLVNNLNDGMAWGLFPLFFAAAQMSLAQIGELAAVYPATWGIAQLATGALSDRLGRKWLIAGGMWVQASGIVAVIVASRFGDFALGAALLGIGTAMVYPTLLAAIGDVAHPSWRASSVGVYRLWRDLGYAVGAVLAGITADALGLPAAMGIVAAITFASGLWVAVRMTETAPPRVLDARAP